MAKSVRLSLRLSLCHTCESRETVQDIGMSCATFDRGMFLVSWDQSLRYWI